MLAKKILFLIFVSLFALSIVKAEWWQTSATYSSCSATTKFVSCCHCWPIGDVKPAGLTAGTYHASITNNLLNCPEDLYHCLAEATEGFGEAGCDKGYLNCDGGITTNCPANKCSNDQVISSCGKYNGCETPCSGQCSYDSQCDDGNPCTLNICNKNEHCSFCEFPLKQASMIQEAEACCPIGAYYDTDIDCSTCPGGKIACDFLSGRQCKTPICYSNAQCSTGTTCINPGECNAFCGRAGDADYNVVATANEEINGVTYEFNIFELSGTDTLRASIYLGEEKITDGLRSGAYFTISDLHYRIFFTSNPYTISVYNVAFYTRTTYDIFPVCGNGICETCESTANCLHYPPESCISCALDCPGVTENEINWFNGNYTQSVNYADLLIDNDLACKVKNNDVYSVCNPLCTTHEFIDSSGCLFSRYADSMPEYANGTLVENATEKTINFQGRTYEVFVRPLDSGFLGEDNSKCTSNCECKDNNCVDSHCCSLGFEWSDTDLIGGTICDDFGHVLDEAKVIFEDSLGGGTGFALPDGFIDNTQTIYSTGEVSNSDAELVTKYLCLDSNNSNILACKAGMDPVCVYTRPDGSFEPIKQNGVFQCRQKDSITRNLAREIKCTIHSHAWALSNCQSGNDIFGNCKDGQWVYGQWWSDDNQYVQPYCITDNPNDCGSRIAPREILYSAPVVLRTISLDDYCTTPSLVCASTTAFTNTVDGGLVRYVDCMQDSSSIGARGAFATNDEIAYHDYPDIMTVGYYCSLFGNDIERILNINAGTGWNVDDDGNAALNASGLPSGGEMILPISDVKNVFTGSQYDLINNKSYAYYNGYLWRRINHVPNVDRDSEERLYHELWNMEACKAIFKDRVPDCASLAGASSEVERTDVKVYHHSRLTMCSTGVFSAGENSASYTQIIKADESGNIVNTRYARGCAGLNNFYTNVYNSNDVEFTAVPFYSRGFCEKFWEAYESKYGSFKYAYDTSRCEARSGQTNIFQANVISDSAFVTVDGVNYPITVHLAYETGYIVPQRGDCPSPIIEYSCLQWYKPWLDDYYSGRIDDWSKFYKYNKVYGLFKYPYLSISYDGHLYQTCS